MPEPLGSRAGREDRGRSAASPRPASRSRPGGAPPRSAPRADPARWVAYQVLLAVAVEGAYANLVLPETLTDQRITGRDAALATELTYGTLRASGTLDLILARCSNRPLAKIDTGVLALAQLGAYQLLKTRIPSHAAVASTVQLARTSGNVGGAGFLNAVLRKVSARTLAEWLDDLCDGVSPIAELGIRYDHPEWIVAAFADALAAEGDAQTEAAAAEELRAALEADDARPLTHLVAWPGRITQAQLAEQSRGTAGPYSPYAVRLVEGGLPAALPAIAEHHAGVQDEGSQLCALAFTQLALTGPDERWLDLCAGPGGKTALLAAIAASRGAGVHANELHPHRARLVAALTTGWPVQITVGDAIALQPDGEGYDRVLLDAPCTGLGALRRRPEARWRRSQTQLLELVRLQRELLAAAVRLVRPGGVVAYVACSPHLAETRQQLEVLLATVPGLEPIDARPAFGAAVTPAHGDPPAGDPPAQARTGEGAVQLWPHRHGTDAMFFAAVRRVF